ncbi:MAG: helix-turn-helix transcriptional regulator [Candidatus Competibacteraceae bacterium]|nr:helix-turn-helix transcriptional regulator [Candidatus Competibacteraceae bacterium]
MTNALGEKIRHLRKGKRLTLDKLAELTDSSKSYIWELENKNPPRPSAEKLAKIAEKLDVTIEYLLDENEEIRQEDAVDARFYRDYRKMEPDTKKKIREMVRLWGKSE